jgi:hypothetical protein
VTCPEVRCWCIGAGLYGWQPDSDGEAIVCHSPQRLWDRCRWRDLPRRCKTGAPSDPSAG